MRATLAHGMPQLMDDITLKKAKLNAILMEKKKRMGVTPLSKVLEYPKQLELTMSDAPIRVMLGGNRPLDEETFVWMADGTFKKLKDIVVGDRVVDGEGRRTVVTGIPFVSREETVQMVMSTGETVVATKDHEFLSIDRHNRSKRMRKAKDIRPGYFICRGKIEYPRRDFYIHPWLVGFLVGDGCLGQSVRFSTADKELLPVVSSMVGEFGCEVRQGGKYDFSIANRNRRGNVGITNKNMLLRELSAMGLMGKDAFEKRVPAEYMVGNTEQRLELLAGLVDSDGYIDLTKKVSGVDFCTVSEGLKDDIVRLVASLGGKSHVRKRFWRKFYHYRIYFRLPRLLPLRVHKKAAHQYTGRFRCNFTVASVQDAGVRNVRCISVGSDLHSFILANGMITSNTGKSEWGAHEMARFMHKRHPKIRFDASPIEMWSACPSFDVQEETTQKKLMALLDPQRIVKTTKLRGDILLSVQYRADDGTVSKVNFKSYEQGRSKFQGAGKVLCWFDEEPPKDIWDEAGIRYEAGRRLYVILTMTPVNGMSWVYDDIYLQTMDPNIKLVTAEWNDNVFLTEDQKREMRSKFTDQALLMREKGMFVQRTGLVCPWFRRDKHVIDDIFSIIPPECDWYAGIDFGYSMPACVIYVAVDYDDNWYLADGVYKRGLTNPDLAEIMKRKEQGLRMRTRWADSAQASDIEELCKAGLPVGAVVKATGTDNEGWDEYRARLLDYHGRVQPGTGRPKIFISSKLVMAGEKDGKETNWAVRELENLRWDEVRRDGMKVQRPRWEDACAKHFVDALTYFAHMYKMPPERKKPGMAMESMESGIDTWAL